jgi:phage antirepressor YoqD-like protein
MKTINGCFTIAQTAKLINFPGGEKKFFAWLRDNGYLLEENFPVQKYRDQGWFEMTTKTLYQMQPKQVVPVTLVTIKGLAALERIVKKIFSPCPPCPPVRRNRTKRVNAKKKTDEQPK